MGGSAADQMLMMEEHEQKMRQKAFRKAKESKEMAEKSAAAEGRQKEVEHPPMRAFADMAAPGGLVNTRNIHRV